MGEHHAPVSPLPLREGVWGWAKATLRARCASNQPLLKNCFGKNYAANNFMACVSAANFHSVLFTATSFVCLLDLSLRWTVANTRSCHMPNMTAVDRKWLHNENFRVLRFWNLDIFENINGVVDRIDTVMREGPLPPPPSRKGRG
jgi:hypothetical protein